MTKSKYGEILNERRMKHMVKIIIDTFNSISEKYCYPTMVGKKLNCEVVNFAEGCRI